jgi:hypothetical protein
MQEGQHNCCCLNPIKQQQSMPCSCNPASRVHFYIWLLQSVTEGESNPKFTLFSDEAWLHLQGYINMQNSWSSQNPHLNQQVLLQPVKVCGWCAVSVRIIRPVFTSEDNTTRYWREQKARDKLQIAEELNNGLMNIKSRLLKQTLGNKIQFETSGQLSWEVKNFTRIL